MVNRRQLLQRSAALGMIATGPLTIPSQVLAALLPNREWSASEGGAVANPLTPPAQGSIPIAFLISDGAVMIDFTGPWEVFQDVSIATRSDAPFRLYTVAEWQKPVHASGGMKILPDYGIANAPTPKVLVIPAQSKASENVKAWIRTSAKRADVVMSVCNGSFVLASTGLLSGKAATAHHSSYANLETMYPDIQVKRGLRFVEDGNLASAGGLSSGIDLALRIVERYFGTEVARKTAFSMEYQGEGWLHPESNAIYAQKPPQSVDHPVCPVCGMDSKLALKTEYKGTTYFFCNPGHKKTFDDSPDKFAKG
jgi:putative intracellular protease/amidase/YHS domain-containing protein